MHRYLHSVEDFLEIDDEYVVRASSMLGSVPGSRKPRDYSEDDDDFDDYEDDFDADLDLDEDVEYEHDDRDDDRY